MSVNVADLTSDILLADVKLVTFIKHMANVVADHRLAMWACTLHVLFLISLLALALLFAQATQNNKGSTVFSMQYHVKYTMCRRIIQKNISTGKLPSIFVAKAKKYPKCNISKTNSNIMGTTMAFLSRNGTEEWYYTTYRFVSCCCAIVLEYTYFSCSKYF